MQPEILNIEYHIKPMVLKALNKSKNTAGAAKLLGVSERTVHRYKENYKIVWDKVQGQYTFKH